jgi:hypothetical protein
MSSIKVTITGGDYAGTITGNTYSLPGVTNGKWVYSNGFMYQDSTPNYILLVFNTDKTVSYATSSIPFTGNPTVSIVNGVTWSGTLPSTFIDSARKQINAGEQELYRVRGTATDSFQSTYQDTMLAGILVAMLGTTVLFYAFRQL